MIRRSAKKILLVIICSILYPLESLAQVIPDNTLGEENSKINSIDELRDRIEGGAARGENLFHSFQEFNVGEGKSVEFTNPAGIENIFSRVTGGNISKILGELGVDGGGNLLLMNPNGIIFGENARLNVSGSFLATTAETIDFSDGSQFSAVEGNSNASLTVEVPIGLGMGSNPGEIGIRGGKNNVLVETPSFKVNTDNLPQGIEVDSGQNISLIGGEISFIGGGVKAPGGNIEIAGIDGGETVKLTPTSNWLKINFSKTLQLKNISLENAAYIDVSSEQAGNINLIGRNILLNGGSAVLANTNLATGNAINIDASESLIIKGTSGQFNADNSVKEIEQILSDGSGTENNGNSYSVSLIGADIFSATDGRGNDININTRDLQIYDAGQIRTVSFSQVGSAAGNINLTAGAILVEGANGIDGLLTSVINSSTGIGTNGNSGNVNISSQSLQLENGGRIKVDSFGSGSGGNLEVNSEDIYLRGFVEPFSDIIFTGLSTSSLGEGKNDGIGGNIDINTKTLSVLDGARISSDSFGRNAAGIININADSIKVAGSTLDKFLPSSISASVARSEFSDSVNETDRAIAQPGSIVINTGELKVLNGAAIEAFTTRGNSGNITITAREIELNGTRPKVGNFIGGISTSVQESESQSGDGGDIKIETNSLKVLNGSIIRSVSLGSGDGGDISIDAESIEVAGVDRFAEDPTDNRRISKINTGALKSNSGNLQINADSISLNNSGILQATTEGKGEGGNIGINSSSLELLGQSQITASAEGNGNGGNITINANTIRGKNSSNITASASAGNGGNIQIDTKGLFLFPDSTIEASSELGIDGRVQINTLDTNLQRDLEPSELNLITPEESLANSCLVRRNSTQGSFSISQGSSLSNTGESDFYDSGSITGMDNSFTPSDIEQLPIFTPQSLDNSIPAQQAVKTKDGRVFLVSAPESVKSLICN